MKNVLVTISGTSRRLLAGHGVKWPEGGKSWPDASRLCRGELLWLWEEFPLMLTGCTMAVCRTWTTAFSRGRAVICIFFVAQNQHYTPIFKAYIAW